MIFRRRQFGFTLIEVISAAVIMAVALAVVVGSIANSIAASRDVEFAATAHMICGDKLTHAALGDIEKLPASGEEVFPRVKYKWTINSQPVTQKDYSMSILTCEVSYDSHVVTMQRRIAGDTGGSDAAE